MQYYFLFGLQHPSDWPQVVGMPGIRAAGGIPPQERRCRIYAHRLGERRALRSSIQVVAGDGAKWITSAGEEYCPHCGRCVAPFHVGEWAMEAVDEVRRIMVLQVSLPRTFDRA